MEVMLDRPLWCSWASAAIASLLQLNMRKKHFARNSKRMKTGSVIKVENCGKKRDSSEKSEGLQVFLSSVVAKCLIT